MTETARRRAMNAGGTVPRPGPVRILPPARAGDLPGHAAAYAAFARPDAAAGVLVLTKALALLHTAPPEGGLLPVPDPGADSKGAASPDDRILAVGTVPVVGPPQTAAPAARLMFSRSRPGAAPVKPGMLVLPLLVFTVLAVIFSGLALTGKPLRVPVWAVAEAEARLNRAIVEAMDRATVGDAAIVTTPDAGTAAVSLGGIVVRVDRDWVPRVLLEDVRLLQPDGRPMVVVPEARVSLDPAAIGKGQVRLRSLRLVGPRFALRRETDGRFDIALGRGIAARPVDGFGGLIDAALAAFESPAFSSLQRIEAEGLTLIYDDRSKGRVWDMGDGRLRLDNRPDELALQMGVSLVAGGATPARADLTLVAVKATSEARLTVTVDQVAASDIAAQADPLAFLGVLEAPISGQIVSALDTDGKVASLEARLALGAGALRPTLQAEPVAFDSARLLLGYDPLRERLDLREVAVQSQTLRLAASGFAYLPGVSSGRPQEVLGQVQFSDVWLDPEGLFDEALRFDQGALDIRLRLDPFTLDIGQLALVDQDRRVLASGQVQVAPEGWQVRMDLGLNQITHDRLLALWPHAVVPRTRDWIAQNVLDGQLSNVKAALRITPGEEPRLSLGYDFSGGNVRFLRSLPPITNGHGYAVVEGTTYLMYLAEGQVTPPEGGAIDVAGSVFRVPDVTQHPTRAEITLQTTGSLTATLSLLDQPPFSFLTKAGQSAHLGEGRAEVKATLRLPLMKNLPLSEVAFDVSGKIFDFRSDKLVPGRRLAADVMEVTATSDGLRIGGKGTLQDVPFEAAFIQQFGPAHAGQSRVEGVVELSSATVERLKLGLPPGLIRGVGRAQIAIALNRGQAPLLRLQSDLAGVGLAVPALGWAKPVQGTGRLEVQARLGKPAAVDQLLLEAAGLRAEGSVRLKADGSLDLARFARLKVGSWLDVSAELTGRGAGRDPAVALTGGRADLRGLPSRSAAAGGRPAPPLDLALDELLVTDAIRLTGFRSRLDSGAAGMAGDFLARVNGAAPIRGTLVPTARGAAVRIRAEDAGAIFSSARIFPDAAGGSFDLILNPTGQTGSFDGTLTMTNLRIRKVPALAELLSAISVVGLLEQMNGSGILFSEAEAEFRLTPRAIQITRGSAVGASMGVSVEGLYVNDGGRLNLQGVISPIYLLNGLGAFLTRRGEGLFGFNYALRGTAKDPKVSVNPLSILTPGMFREMFRAAPPRLERARPVQDPAAAAGAPNPTTALPETLRPSVVDEQRSGGDR